RWLVRRTDWAVVPASPIVKRRRAGQVLRAGWGLYRRDFGARLLFGLIYVPTAFIAALVAGLVALVPVLDDVFHLAGDDSPTGVVFALAAGGIANLFAYVIVNGLVAAYMDDSVAKKRSPMESARFVWSKAGVLTKGFFRATLIVGGLIITVVGIPWGIRQLVRYQFLPQAVVLEGRDGRDALASSSDLVKGRWFHTALLITLFNGVVAASGMAFGLLLLVFFSSIPLWLFNALVPLIYGLTVPLTASAQTLLYGDAVAEDAGIQPGVADVEVSPAI
ncbi:MAG: hypothetical protein ACR2PK_14075, partial [Acidimicrobiales bacterium]